MRFRVYNRRPTRTTRLYKEFWSFHQPCKQVLTTHVWFQANRLVRKNGLHKLDVFHKNLGKGYSFSRISDAKIHGRFRFPTLRG